MEKMSQESHEWQNASQTFFAHKMWALNASGPIIGAHLKTLMEYPPSQGADTLSLKKALEEMQAKMERAAAGGASK
jgi:arylsulfatase